jgi:hypothetical protein
MYGCLRNDYYVFFSNSQGVVLGVWFTLSTLPLMEPKVHSLCALRLPARIRAYPDAAFAGPPPG